MTRRRRSRSDGDHIRLRGLLDIVEWEARALDRLLDDCDLLGLPRESWDETADQAGDRVARRLASYVGNTDRLRCLERRGRQA